MECIYLFLFLEAKYQLSTELKRTARSGYISHDVFATFFVWLYDMIYLWLILFRSPILLIFNAPITHYNYIICFGMFFICLNLVQFMCASYFVKWNNSRLSIILFSICYFIYRQTLNRMFVNNSFNVYHDVLKIIS